MSSKNRLEEMEEFRQDLKEKSYAKEIAKLEVKIRKNETLAEFYIRFSEQFNDSLTFDDFYDAANIPINDRNDFATAAILKGAQEIISNK